MKKSFAVAVAAIGLSPLGTGYASAQAIGAAPAQAPSPGTTAAAASRGLQEIIVTAERVRETSQHAPVALTTLTGNQITRANITRPGALTALVPALQASDDTGPYSIFYVRGVGNFAANGLSDPAVLFNFDGVPVSRSGTSGFYYDLQRVEVLKGPQGTLYGRNATGGAINVISNAPVLDQFSGNASLDYGNYSAVRYDAALNLPIGEKSAVRLAGFHAQHDGYNKDGTDNQNDSGGRLSFLTKPTDILDVSVVADYFTQGGQAAGGNISGVTNSFAAPPSFGISDRLGFFSPQAEAYLVTQKDFLNGANFVPFQNLNHENNRSWGIESTIDLQTPIGTLTLVPAHRDSRLDYNSFATGVNLRELSDERQTTVEARLTSSRKQALQYVIGLFYLHDPQDTPAFNVNQQSNVAFQQYDTDTTSRAAFANLTYAITPTVRLNGGVRYTKDDKSFTGTFRANTIICTVQTAFGPSCPNAGVFPYTDSAPVPPVFFNPNGTITTLTSINDNQSDSYSRVTWRGGAAWDITDQNMMYANVETGFKSGGFFFSSDRDIYLPETITAYTVGSKNRFLENRLQLNLELYYWKYRNQQISHLSTDSLHQTIFPTENVGLATYKGFELSMRARPFSPTTVSAEVQYNDGYYNSFLYHVPNNNGGINNGTGCPNAAAPAVFYTVSCSGKQPPYAPRWTITAGVEQSAAMPADAVLVGSANVHYQSETLTALEFLPAEQQPGYATWDFDLTYYAAENRYYIGGYVDNACNKTALNFSFVTPFSSIMTASLRPPRTYGVRVGARF